MFGERYIEPQGNGSIINSETGDTCVTEFKKRQWNTKADDKNYVTCTIKNKDGQLRYTVQGKYTEKLTCTDHVSGETSTVFEAPVSMIPADSAKMFGMNIYSL